MAQVVNVDVEAHLRWLETGIGPRFVQSPETRRRAWPAVSRKDAELRNRNWLQPKLTPYGRWLLYGDGT